MIGRKLARPRQRRRPLSQRQGDEEEDRRCTMRSTSPSSWRCKTTTMASVLFLVTLLWLPQPGTAEWPNGEPPRLQPTACIERGSELLNAIRDYYGGRFSYEHEVGSSAARTYGWPIDSWCVSSDVEDKLMRDESPLNEHLSAAVHNTIALHDDDEFVTPDANQLISDWSLSFAGQTCLDLCFALNDGSSFSATTNSFPSDKENVTNYDTKGGEEKQDQGLLGDSASDSYEDAINNTEYQESPHSSSQSSGSRNTTTTGMLFRLIPMKLVCVLSLMCLVLGVRQMFLSAEDGNGYCCCCKLGCSLFGFLGSGGYATYEGIDPSDVEDHQKSVEFELLQLAASGDVDVDVEAHVVIS